MSDFPEKAEDEVNTLAVVAIGLSTTAILWASVLALQAYFMNSEGEIATQQAQNGRAAIVRGLKAEHRGDLSRTTYADRQKGTLKRLDIKFAKEVVVRDAQRRSSLIPTLKKFNSDPNIDLDGNPLKKEAPAAVPPVEGAPPAVDGTTPSATGVAPVPASAPRGTTGIHIPPPGAVAVPTPAPAAVPAPVVPAPTQTPGGQ